MLRQVLGAPGEEVGEGRLPRQETELVPRCSPEWAARKPATDLQLSLPLTCHRSQLLKPANPLFIYQQKSSSTPKQPDPFLLLFCLPKTLGQLQ